MEKTELSSWESLTLKDQVKISATLSRATKKFYPLSLDSAAFAAEPEELLAALRFYSEQSFELRPEEFFRKSLAIPKLEFSLPHSFSGGEVVDISFPSAYQPHYQSFLAKYSACEANRNVHARLWRHTQEQSLGTVVAVHGWMMGDSRLSALTLVPGFFFRLGLDVVMYELPYHGHRRCDSGSSPLVFPSANIACTNEGFGQAISDLRALSNWVNREQNKPIGAIGLSLGGYTAALWAALDPLSFVICAAPLACLGEFSWDFLLQQSKSLRFGELLRSGVLTIGLLKAAYAVHSPLSYPAQVTHNNRLILAGTDDVIVPPIQPQMLWEHWEKPQAQWLSGGHLGQMVAPTTLTKVHEFLHQRGFAHHSLISL